MYYIRENVSTFVLVEFIDVLNLVLCIVYTYIIISIYQHPDKSIISILNAYFCFCGS